MTNREFLTRFIEDCTIRSDDTVTVFEVSKKWLDQPYNAAMWNSMLDKMKDHIEDITPWDEGFIDISDVMKVIDRFKNFNDPDDLTHIFDGMTEVPDVSKWTIDNLRKEGSK